MSCNVCGGTGHYANECTSPGGGAYKGGGSGKGKGDSKGLGKGKGDKGKGKGWDSKGWSKGKGFQKGKGKGKSGKGKGMYGLDTSQDAWPGSSTAAAVAPPDGPQAWLSTLEPNWQDDGSWYGWGGEWGSEDYNGYGNSGWYQPPGLYTLQPKLARISMMSPAPIDKQTEACACCTGDTISAAIEFPIPQVAAGIRDRKSKPRVGRFLKHGAAGRGNMTLDLKSSYCGCNLECCSPEVVGNDESEDLAVAVDETSGNDDEWKTVGRKQVRVESDWNPQITAMKIRESNAQVPKKQNNSPKDNKEKVKFNSQKAVVHQGMPSTPIYFPCSFGGEESTASLPAENALSGCPSGEVQDQTLELEWNSEVEVSESDFGLPKWNAAGLKSPQSMIHKKRTNCASRKKAKKVRVHESRSQAEFPKPGQNYTRIGCIGRLLSIQRRNGVNRDDPQLLGWSRRLGKI